MKVYIVASVSGHYMIPVTRKVYKKYQSAKQELDKQNECGRDRNLKVLCADSWYEVAE